MALTHWGFIYHAPGSPADGEFTVHDTGECRTVLVGVATSEQGAAVARKLVADGAQLIELCGGFGPLGTAHVLEAIDGAVPVGQVGYGPESIAGAAAIFS